MLEAQGKPHSAPHDLPVILRRKIVWVNYGVRGGVRGRETDAASRGRPEGHVEKNKASVDNFFQFSAGNLGKNAVRQKAEVKKPFLVPP